MEIVILGLRSKFHAAYDIYELLSVLTQIPVAESHPYAFFS
jgi:hypothetical protein